MPSLCEICGKVYCDHTREERGLSKKEWKVAMTRPLTEDEMAAWESMDPEAKIRAARPARRKITERPVVSPTEK